MAKRPELLITSGPMAGTRFEVGAGGVRLGRSSSNDVSIPDEELSRNHCLFEQSGEAGVRVTDLASANGTFVNGEQLGSDSRELVAGDAMEVGSTAISVVGEEPPPAQRHATPVARGASIDLGLGKVPAAASQGKARPSARKPDGPPRAMLANVLWIVAALIVAVAIAVVLCAPRDSEKPVVAPVAEEKPEKKLISLCYEKIEADASRVFSYRMDVDKSGVLHVAFDDVPGENRHVDKKAKLSEKAMKRILEVLDRPGFAALDDESIYDGPSRLAQPDETWNYGTGDGLEKCLLAANVLGGTEIRVADGTAALMDGERAVCTFPTAKHPRDKIWQLAAETKGANA